MLKVITADTRITYRLLRFLNSAAFGFSMKIGSVRHAIALLGSNRLRYWLRMVWSCLGHAQRQSEPELALMALNRGKFLEELALERQIIDAEPETMSLFGMLSLIDTMLEMPLNRSSASCPRPNRSNPATSTPIPSSPNICS
ncbi:MAG: HDOD domain-containing protein [Syntrophotaleaceae bacterium]